MPDSLLTGINIGNAMNLLPFIILFAINAGVLGNLLYYKSISKVQASSAGVLLLTEPLVASLLALAFFFQPLTINIILGGAFIILSNYVIIRWVE
jgi:drug/metabolite transporter (DMT)-like permease